MKEFLKFIPKEKVTSQKYYNSKTKKEDKKKLEDANNIWLSFNSPLCSHSPFESHNSLEWRLNRTKRSPHP